MNARRYSVGDMVDMSKWDRHELPAKRIGTPARVVRVETGCYCETGVMLTVVGPTGRQRVSMAWVEGVRDEEGCQ